MAAKRDVAHFFQVFKLFHILCPLQLLSHAEEISLSIIELVTVA